MLGRPLGLAGGFLLRIVLIVVVMVLFVTLMPTVATLLGGFMGDLFVQQFAPPSPS